MDWDDAAREYARRVPTDAGLSALPAEWQRGLVALMLLGREVWNGGYMQFFANRGREASEYAGRALRAIGARRMAELLAGCQALIDEHFAGDGRSADERSRVLPDRVIGTDGRTLKEPGVVPPESVVARLSELSWALMEYPDDVAVLAQAHYGPLIEVTSGRDGLSANRDRSDRDGGVSFRSQSPMS